MLLDTILPKSNAKSTRYNSHLVSLLKSISWRIVGTIDTMLIAYFITGKIDMALSIGFIEIFTKLTLFYFHERVWELAKRKSDHNEE